VTRVIWDDIPSRLYHTGIDRGMLYIPDAIPVPVAVPWTGLVSITENPDGGDGQAFFIDGRKHQNTPAGEDYKATLESLWAPKEFYPCAGWNQLSIGLFAVDQPRASFGFSYRTKVGSYAQGTDYAYKIHIIFNATAQIANFTHTTVTNNPQPKTHSWTVTACPSPEAYIGATNAGRQTSHVVFDTRRVSETGIKFLENILYGYDNGDPRLPTIAELQALRVLTDSTGSVDLKKPAVNGTAILTGNYADIYLHKPSLSGHN
jgi:hypothetical protein